jgi:hypothetical protein
LHGLFAGTDSKQWVQFMYLGSGLAVLFLTFFRILASRRAAAPKKRETPPPAVAPPAVAEGANS